MNMQFGMLLYMFYYKNNHSPIPGRINETMDIQYIPTQSFCIIQPWICHWTHLLSSLVDRIDISLINIYINRDLSCQVISEFIVSFKLINV